MATGQKFVVEKKRKRRLSSSAYFKKSGVFATPLGTSLGSSGETRDSVLQAAKVFRDQAAKNASGFSRRIPTATYVAGSDEQRAMVITDGSAAPNAAPFEFGERHPLNYPNQRKAIRGSKRPMAPQGVPPKPRSRPYMSKAATNQATIDQAADVYAEAEKQLLAEELGWDE